MAGLSNSGFQPLSLTEIQADLQAALQQQFGGTAVDLSSQSFWGQLIGIIANANADLWEGLSALYSASYPAGASGVAVDNILAINGLSRLTAKYTVTNPTPTAGSNGQILYGLILSGTPGTVVPAGSLFSTSDSSPNTFALDRDVTIAAANNDQQTIYFTNQPTSGTYQLVLTSPSGDVLTTSSIPYDADIKATTLAYASYQKQDPNSWQLTIDGTKTVGISWGGSNPDGTDLNPLTAQKIQTAINSIAGYESVSVVGSAQTKFLVNWNLAPVGNITVSGEYAPDIVKQSINSIICSLANSANVRPFTDVALTGSAQAVQVLFGQNTPATGMPSSGSAYVPLIQITGSTLARGTSQTFVNIVHKQEGSSSVGAGTATCTQSGAVAVLANQLTTIVNPVSGLDSVNNQLDCLTGRDVETDAEAIARLSSTRGTAASGSLAAILARVKALTGVTQAVGFQNASNAAQQVIQFASAPTQGQFNIIFNGQVTPLLAYNVSAADVQTAIQGLSGYAATTVSAYGLNGYLIDFKGDAGRQSQSLAQFPANTTGAQLAAYFGRGAHSIEVIAQGGADADIANAILATLPAGIGTYSSPALRTVASLTQGNQQITPLTTANIAVGQQVLAPGIPLGSIVSQISNGVVSLSQAPTQTASNVPISFSYGALIADGEGNNVEVSFSRATSVLIYAEIELTTDLYNTPGQPSSGLNPNAKFSQSSVSAIQQGIIDLINGVEIGGTIVANGTNSLGGSFRNVEGILSYDIIFDRVAPPTNSANLTVAANEAPLAESYSVSVSVQ